MVDKSVAGWNIVDEYLTDELASDCDDEKRLTLSTRCRFQQTVVVKRGDFGSSLREQTYLQAVSKI